MTLALTVPSYKGIKRWSGKHDIFRTMLETEESRRKRGEKKHRRKNKSFVSWFARMFMRKPPGKENRRADRLSERIVYSLF